MVVSMVRITYSENKQNGLITYELEILPMNNIKPAS